MTFKRTRDATLIWDIMSNPRIWRHITDDGSPPPDEVRPNPEAQGMYFYLVYDGDELLGLFMFVEVNTVCWEVHTCLLPCAWGLRSVDAAREMSEWIWANTGCKRIITTVPEYNRLALALAKHAGLVEYGVNTKAWLKDGKLHDLHMLGISPPEGKPCQRSQRSSQAASV